MAEPNLFADFRENARNDSIVPDVFVRTRWDLPWEQFHYLRCDNAQWVLNPGTSTATLSWKYGLVQQADAVEQVLFPPFSGQRLYVKIVFSNFFNNVGGTTEGLVWHGIVNGVAAKAGGVRDFAGEFVETGEQAIHCVGLEKLLDDTVIRTSVWSDAGALRRIDRGLTFNAERADGTMGGNRSSEIEWVDGKPTFTDTIRDDDQFWTTPHALKYVIGWHKPKDRIGTELPVYLDLGGLDHLVLIADRPQINLHGKTVREVLNLLLPHERFVSWKLEVDIDTNEIFVVPITLTGDDLMLPSGDVIVANPVRWSWDMDGSRGDGVLTLSHAEAVDRVRVQGARATSTFSIAYADSTLEARYTAAQKTLFDTGATGTTPYTATTNLDLKNRLHKARRAQADCNMVYSHFGIPNAWTGTAGNGEGGAGGVVFPIDTETTDFQFYKRELYIEPFTQLRDGYVYTALNGAAGGGGSFAPGPDAVFIPPVKSDTGGPHNHLPIQVWLKVPDSGAEDGAADRWVNVEKIGLAADTATIPDDPEWKFSAHVTVPRMDRAFLIKISGGEQYVIAGADYTKKTEEPNYTPWDWKEMIATVTVKWDSYCEGFHPALPDVSLNDHIREVVLDAGDEYRLDWLVPNTVVSLDNNGQLVRSTAGGWFQDDRRKLEDRARLAFAWYGVERRSVQLPTSKINGSIKLGDFVVSAGVAFTKAVNTVVTSIRIDCPGSPGPDAAIPMLTYTTDYIPDLDLFLTPNLEKSVPRAPTPAVAPGGRALTPFEIWKRDLGPQGDGKFGGFVGFEHS